MFRSTLISSETYYRTRKKLFWLWLIWLLPGALIWPAFMISGFWGMMAVIVQIFVLVWAVRLSKQYKALMAKQRIEIEDRTITIRDESGRVESQYAVADGDKVLAKEAYEIAGNRLALWFSELLGRPSKNHLTLIQGDHSERFEFVLESHYAIERLRSTLQQWQTQGIRVYWS